ncbi:MAG: DnaA N-terminal domain-containing protein [Chloroflexota bacterium]|nr:replication protein [Dehalococcoidia bacterium]MDW8252522.1 DnaA N-terminal domain-containing protein [Chloroflexota bacterium]
MTETFVFEGFSAPGYTQVPDEFFDVCLPHLSGSETKVMCYLFRRTFGWKKESDAVSLSQLTDGIVRRDGTRLDGGAGVTRETAANALRSLERKGLIVREPQVRADGGTGTTVYRIRFRTQSANPTPPGRNSDPPPSAAPTPRVETADSVPVGTVDRQDSRSTTKRSHQPANTQVDWPALRSALRGRFSRANWETYIAPLALERLEGGRAILRAPTPFVADWVRSRFASAIATALAEAAGQPISVEIVAA